VRVAQNVVVVVVVAAALAILIVNHTGGDAMPSVTGKNALVIGIDGDRPGLGTRDNAGHVDGFDVDVGTYIAGRLGVAEDDVTFRPVPENERDRVLRDGTVDLLVAGYPITPERKRQTTFAGPFYVAHQDILVRDDDESIKNVRDLDGKRLCQVTGSSSWRRVTEERKIAADPVPARSYPECVAMLTTDKVDAVSTDDLVLASFAATGTAVALAGAPFTDERYGVGLRKGDIKGCERVNEIITEMYQNGTARTMLTQRWGSAGLNLTTTVPRFEGCT
jgi:glutamate transport system substrate-binding protein